MSILIKGMKMPKTCFSCDFNDGLFCSLIDDDNDALLTDKPVEEISTRRLDDCPLIEIPTPHGRLIDADALFEAMGLDTVKEVMLRNWKFTTAWGVPIIETEE